MRTVIISDLHNRVDWIESTLSILDFDKVVFLGDYFDDFDDTVAGIIWLDWHDEFDPVPHLDQIVGHTQLNIPEEKTTLDSRNYCMDTGNKHIGILEDGVFTWKKIL